MSDSWIDENNENSESFVMIVDEIEFTTYILKPKHKSNTNFAQNSPMYRIQLIHTPSASWLQSASGNCINALTINKVCKSKWRAEPFFDAISFDISRISSITSSFFLLFRTQACFY